MRVFLLLGLAACATRVEGLVEHDLGGRCTYQLYVPATAARPAPLVVALHRFTEDGELMAKLTGLNAVADREGFVVVYPDGPGRRFEAFDSEKRDDVPLILDVIEDVAARVPIDRRRVYLTGASNGGFMTHRLACLRPDVFAAAAPVMALLPKELADRVPGGAPVPMLIVHGTDDWIVNPGATKVFAGKKYEVLPIVDTVHYWVRRNGSHPRPQSVMLENTDPDDKTTIERLTYSGTNETIYYRVVGGGHTWPGGTERAPRWIVGRTSRDASASEIIWEFFARHSR